MKYCSSYCTFLSFNNQFINYKQPPGNLEDIMHSPQIRQVKVTGCTILIKLQVHIMVETVHISLFTPSTPVLLQCILKIQQQVNYFCSSYFIYFNTKIKYNTQCVFRLKGNPGQYYAPNGRNFGMSQPLQYQQPNYYPRG